MNKKIIFTAILLSLILRMSLAFALKDDFLARGNRYHSIQAIADNLMQNKEFSLVKGVPTAINEPVYTGFIALIFFLFGKSWFMVAFFQSLACLAAAFCIFRIALEMFSDRRIALLAFLFSLFYPFYITQSISISDTVLFTFFLALSIMLLLLAVRKESILFSVFAGVAWGLTLQVRFSGIAIFAFVLLYPFIMNKFATALKKVLLISIVCLTVMMPWIVRNYNLTGKIFVSTRAIELWFGYNADSRQVIASDVSVDVMRQGMMKKIPQLQEIRNKFPQQGIQMEVAESEIYLQETIAFIKKEPGMAIGMMPLKFWKFWSWKKTPRTNSLKEKRGRSEFIWDLLYSLAYIPVLLFGISGIYWQRKKWRTHALLLLAFLGYSLLHTIVYGFSRLRVPIDQFLIIYAACALVYFYEVFKKTNPAKKCR